MPLISFYSPPFNKKNKKKHNNTGIKENRWREIDPRGAFVLYRGAACTCRRLRLPVAVEGGLVQTGLQANSERRLLPPAHQLFRSNTQGEHNTQRARLHTLNTELDHNEPTARLGLPPLTATRLRENVALHRPATIG